MKKVTLMLLVAMVPFLTMAQKKSKKGKFTEYRTVPSDVESPATINIYDDKVAIFIWDDTPQAILIENKNVKRTFENYFNFIWKNSKGLK